MATEAAENLTGHLAVVEPSQARCACRVAAVCPRHYVHVYALSEAKHRAEVAA